MAYVPLGGPDNVLANRAIESVPGYAAARRKLARLDRQGIKIELEFLIAAAYEKKTSSDALHYINKRVPYLTSLITHQIPPGFQEQVVRRARIEYIREQVASFRSKPCLNPKHSESPRDNLFVKIRTQYFVRYRITPEEVGETTESLRQLERLGVINYFKQVVVPHLRRSLKGTYAYERDFADLREHMANYQISCRDIGISKKEKVLYARLTAPVN